MLKPSGPSLYITDDGKSNTIADWCGYQMRVSHASREQYGAVLIGALKTPEILAAQGKASRADYHKNKTGQQPPSSSDSEELHSEAEEEEDADVPYHEMDFVCEDAVTRYAAVHLEIADDGVISETEHVRGVLTLIVATGSTCSVKDSGETRRIRQDELARWLSYVEGTPGMSKGNEARWLKKGNNFKGLLKKMNRRIVWKRAC